MDNMKGSEINVFERKKRRNTGTGFVSIMFLI